MTFIQLHNVTKHYAARRGLSPVKAVHQVHLTLAEGDRLALVGESGSGKSTLAHLLMKHLPLTAGDILFQGQSIFRKEWHWKQHYQKFQLILQDASTSLHPKIRVGELVTETIHNFFPQEAQPSNQALAYLQMVGLEAQDFTKYAHQLSGGQKQRVCIAKALAVQPKVMIFDESLASLDREAQALLLQTLLNLQQQRQMTYLFITHDLQSALQLCNRIAIMYEGEIVEVLSLTEKLQPKHPYSQQLFSTI